MLHATAIHNDLAKRLLRFYPKLINDIYISDEYYGWFLTTIQLIFAYNRLLFDRRKRVTYRYSERRSSIGEIPPRQRCGRARKMHRKFYVSGGSKSIEIGQRRSRMGLRRSRNKLQRVITAGIKFSLSQHSSHVLLVSPCSYRYVYWGEYPLSFAACLGQEECYRLILARGADPDKQDTNGNTVLHMLVIYGMLVSFPLI